MTLQLAISHIWYLLYSFSICSYIPLTCSISFVFLFCSRYRHISEKMVDITLRSNANLSILTSSFQKEEGDTPQRFEQFRSNIETLLSSLNNDKI